MRRRGDAAVTGLRTGSMDARECVRALARAPARDQATGSGTRVSNRCTAGA
jgi:hypothetical protein